ncbi:PREDICTED: calumenin [Nelumbo nucifera]|uniref:Calumenin n=1 Tax=Nelumbo nucifera TaxID=4432 RepID=A0A1U8AWZ7_NELNU|nr:PREDICTED: calumenin [Nelumbo nucifera]
MAKAVVYPIWATVFVIFLITSLPPRKGPEHLRLGRRLGYRHVPFDPLVAHLEKQTEEKGLSDWDSPTTWESALFSSEFGDMEELLNDEGKLNITDRLLVLFPLLDTSPDDGLISLKELVDWNVQQATDRLSYRTYKEMEVRDTNWDGVISLKECLYRFSQEEIEKNDMSTGQAGWLREQFSNADADGDESLNAVEFNDFLHPEDSNNHKVRRWLLREKIKAMDQDKDGRINFKEFSHGAYGIIKSYMELEIGYEAPGAGEKFAELDVNSDEFLTEEELVPVMHHLQPGEISYAKHYASYLMHEADDDRDGSLTLEEMLRHEFVFYGTVFEDDEFNENDDDDDDDDSRDEFR